MQSASTHPSIAVYAATPRRDAAMGSRDSLHRCGMENPRMKASMPPGEKIHMAQPSRRTMQKIRLTSQSGYPDIYCRRFAASDTGHKRCRPLRTLRTCTVQDAFLPDC